MAYRKYKLYTFNNGKSYIRELPNCIKNKSTNEKSIKSVAKDELLRNCLSKLEEYASEDCLQTINNIKSLKVRKIPLLIMLGIGGNYRAKSNVINVSCKTSFKHEFMHVVSSYYDFENKVCYSGFEQRKKLTKIGTSLNEGYTELMTSRVFNQKVSAYKWEVRIAKIFEFFFDDPKDMEKFYFNHNLPGFIKHLEQYASRDEIIKLLIDMDFITPIFININPQVISTYVNVQLTLHKWFKRKCRDNEKLAEFEKLLYKDKLVSFIEHNKTISLYRYNVLEENNGIKL